MNHILLLAIIAGLCGMFGWGFADFFAKKTIDIMGDLATLVWAHLFGVTLLFSLVAGKYLIYPDKVALPGSIKELSIIAFFGALQATVYFFAYRAFSKGKLAILNPIFSSYSGIVVLLSVLIFGEVLKVSQFVLLAIIFSGIVIISLDEKALSLKHLKLKRLPGVNEILFAAILAAVWTVTWGYFVSGKDWLVYAALMYAFMSVTLVLISWQQKVNFKVSDQNIWRYFLFIGMGEVIAYAGISLGYSLTSHVSIVAVLSAAFSIPTLVLAHLFLGERITRLQKFGVTLAVVGVSVMPLL